jgi:uncharacterized protein YkwD
MTVLGASTKETALKIAQGVYNKEAAKQHLKLNRDNIIWFTNYERVKNGQLPMAGNLKLDASALAKNRDMIANNYFNHTRPLNQNSDATVGFDRFIDEQGYEFIKIGENLAMGDFSTSSEVVTAWMKSPTHKKNILDPMYREIGVNIKNGIIKGRQITLVTQHFGDPRSSCPTISSSTKQAIETLKLKASEIQVQISHQQEQLAATNPILDPRFDSLINEYNLLVSLYNTTVNSMGELIDDYNEQVNLFDLCIQGKR